MNPQLEDLKKYIQSSLHNGVSEYDIRTSLLGAGWPDATINEVFQILRADELSAAHQVNKGDTTKIKRRTVLIVLIVLAAIVVLGIVAYQLIRGGSSESTQNGNAYIAPITPDNWTISAIPYDNKVFNFAHPGDWKITSSFNDESGAYSDVRVVTSDYVDVSSTDDTELEGLVRTGAMFDVRVSRYEGDLGSYKKKIESQNSEEKIAIIGGYENLELTSVLERPALSYVQRLNWSRTILIKQGEYIVKFDYFQPYKTSSPDVRPELKDQYIEQLHAMVASLSLSS